MKAKFQPTPSNISATKNCSTLKHHTHAAHHHVGRAVGEQCHAAGHGAPVDTRRRHETHLVAPGQPPRCWPASTTMPLPWQMSVAALDGCQKPAQRALPGAPHRLAQGSASARMRACCGSWRGFRRCPWSSSSLSITVSADPFLSHIADTALKPSAVIRTRGCIHRDLCEIRTDKSISFKSIEFPYNVPVRFKFFPARSDRLP